jgi:Xaa-Pro dipeptidase
VEGLALFRKERLRRAMENESLTMLVASLPENIYYAIGYESVSQALLFKTQVYLCYHHARDLFSLVVPCAEAATAAEQLPDVDIRPYGTFYYHLPGSDPFTRRLKGLCDRSAPTPYDALQGVLGEAGLSGRRVGLDENRILPAVWERLGVDFPDVSLVPASHVFGWMRMIKHEREVQWLQRAAQIAEESLFRTARAMRPGMTESEMAQLYVQEVVRQGARPFFHVITADRRSVMVDTINTDNPVGPGSVVRFDVGCLFQGYRSDMSRTAVLGSVEPRVERYYEALLLGEQTAIERARPGITPEEIFHTALAQVRKTIPHYRRHHVGHGIGLEVYDLPSIAPGWTDPLEPGMVLCIETPYYEVGWNGLQVEDTILITEEGNRPLTQSERTLIRVEV